MQNIGHSYCKEIPLWKWILLFIGGVIVFLLLYSGAQTASMAEVKTPLKVCISLVAASLLVVAYYLVAGKIEKRSETIEGTIIPIWPIFSNISHPHK